MEARPPDASTAGRNNDGGSGDEWGSDFALQERLLRDWNAARQKELVSDTAKLLRLAGDLNAEVCDDRADTPVPIQLHQLETIEKLARSVKEKMSTSVRPAPAYWQMRSPVR